MKQRTLALLIALLLIAPATAQDDACNIDTITDKLTILVDALTADTFNDTLSQIASFASSTRAACDGLTFSSDEYGTQPLIGPIEFPEGIYRATATTAEFFIARIEILEGKCDKGALFNFTPGDGSQGAGAVFRSDGCTAFIQIKNTNPDDPWLLEFEKAN